MTTRTIHAALRVSLCAAAVLLFASAPASAEDSYAEVLFLRGDVTAQRRGAPLEAKVGTRLVSGDTIVAGADSGASLRLFGGLEATDHDHVQVKANTTLAIESLAETAGAPKKGVLGLIKGALSWITGGSGEAKRDVQVHAPTTIGGVRGTEFRMIVEAPGSTRIEVLEGTVNTTGASSELDVGPGKGSRVRPGGEPETLHPLPAAPTVKAGDGGALDRFSFQWSKVQGAASYVVEIALEESFTRIVYEQGEEATQHEPVSAKLPEHAGAFYWRVSAVDADGYQGFYSAAGSFTLP